MPLKRDNGRMKVNFVVKRGEADVNDEDGTIEANTHCHYTLINQFFVWSHQSMKLKPQAIVNIKESFYQG